MGNHLRQETDKELRAEADRLLERGLRAVVNRFGEVHVGGSYKLQLMTWRDLDIHLVRSTLERQAFFEMGGMIADLLRPHRMHYRDETAIATKGLPRGLYWGIYLGDERRGAWKIDIWATDHDGYEPTRAYCEAIEKRLSDSARASILRIKAACWSHPQYRREFASGDIYSAVLDHGIDNIDAFWKFLNDRKESI